MDYRSIGCTTFVALALIGVGTYLVYQHPADTNLPIRNIEVQRITNVPAPGHIEIVDTLKARERGLGGRAVIPDDYGMLFVFESADRYAFWMKDMLASIDMLWLADDGTIVTVTENVSPNTYPNVFYPDAPVKYVLEVRAGEARAHGYLKGVHIEGLIPNGNI